MQVMPSEQGGSDSRNAECRALGKQDFELLLSEEMAELWIKFGGSLEMWVADLELARDAETELCQGFQSTDVSRYFQVGVLHCGCWALTSHQPNSECKDDACFLGRGWSDNTL